MLSRFIVLAASIGTLATGLLLAQPGMKPHPTKLDFNRDVRPILAEKCFKCHGQDLKALQAGLNLDRREIATKPLEDGKTAIVPGHPDQSELVSRIYSSDPDNLMPPPESHKSLKSEEKAILRQWIAEGAQYKAHWAFVPLQRPMPPQVSDSDWPINDIDQFVLATLRQHGHAPSAQADRSTLLRRVTLDLIGLPPTLQEQKAFLADLSPGAYGKVVDRLLASPRYGERMAMDWLDGARYADSNGYQADYERYQYRWRDWVIKAFNDNMPFDQFSVEQIAGDMLPQATIDQRIASGFNRNHRINTEGGVIAEEWRVETIVDRVETVSTVWLGLTAGCARCHDHKYDPISQREFYQMYAYFNNVPESGIGEERPVNHPPLLKAPYPWQASRLIFLNGELRKRDKQLLALQQANASHAASWKLELPVPPAGLEGGKVGRFTLTQAALGKKAQDKPAFESGRSTGAIKTGPEGYAEFGQIGDFDTGQAFSFGAWINPEQGTDAPISKMDAKADYRGYDLFLQDSRPSVHLINKWPQDALKVVSRTKIPSNRWTHVFVTVDGSAKPEGVKIYIDGKPVEKDVEANSLKGTIRTSANFRVGRRTNTDMFVFKGKVDDLALFSRALEASEVAFLADVHEATPLLAMASADRTAIQQNELVRLWSLEHDPAYAKLATDRAKFGAEREKLDEQIPSVMVMQEEPMPRDAFVLTRGHYTARGERVSAALPTFLPPMAKSQPNNRLGFARWIVSSENPLTARVAVNRLWAMLFGTGIVGTSEDFGTRAEFPSHPELLDWLATELIRLKWDMKAMLKTIVMSATYRQASSVTPKLLEADPLNRLLARGPRFRLQAETIRDQALAASGLLYNAVGGPSVRPYQPEGIWDETNFYGNLRNYMPDKGHGLYRRSLYTIWKRTAAPPNMTLFDVPSREICRVRRSRTNTPLQALTLLNDLTFVEAARVLAQRMLLEGGATSDHRLAYGFALVVGRAPNASEAKILKTGLDRNLQHFDANPEAALALIKQGAAPLPANIRPTELAAYSILASVMLNLDEAVTKE